MATKRKIRFPVIRKGGKFYPPDGPGWSLCPICKGPLTDGDKVFQVVLNVGAMRRTGKDEWDGMGNDDLGGMMSIGVHSHGYGCKHAHLDIVDLCRGGQADLTFCSFRCIRAFLNTAVDELEAMWKKAPEKVGYKGRDLK